MSKIIAALATLVVGACTTLPSLPPCPGGVEVTLNVRSLGALPSDLRREAEMLIASAEKRDSRNGTDPGAYGADDVSRTLGYRLRTEVSPAAVNADVRVQLRDPKTPYLAHSARTVRVTAGTGTALLPDDARSYIVEFIWPNDDDFVSPTISAGKRLMLVLRNEWETCRKMNVTALVSGKKE